MYIKTMRSTFYTLFKMVRPINIVITTITLLIGYGLLQHNPTIPVLILQILGFACALGFANIQNDILDLESDKLNRPKRPLVTGEVSVKAAKRAWVALAITMLLCGLGDTIIQIESYFLHVRVIIHYIVILFDIFFCFRLQ